MSVTKQLTSTKLPNKKIVNKIKVPETFCSVYNEFQKLWAMDYLFDILLLRIVAQLLYLISFFPGSIKIVLVMRTI